MVEITGFTFFVCFFFFSNRGTRIAVSIEGKKVLPAVPRHDLNLLFVFGIFILLRSVTLSCCVKLLNFDDDDRCFFLADRRALTCQAASHPSCLEFFSFTPL